MCSFTFKSSHNLPIIDFFHSLWLTQPSFQFLSILVFHCFLQNVCSYDLKLTLRLNFLRHLTIFTFSAKNHLICHLIRHFPVFMHSYSLISPVVATNIKLECGLCLMGENFFHSTHSSMGSGGKDFCRPSTLCHHFKREICIFYEAFPCP